MSPHQQILWMTPSPDTDDCDNGTTRRNRAYAFNAGMEAYHNGDCEEEGVDQDRGRWNKIEARCFKAGYWAGEAGFPPILVLMYEDSSRIL